VGPISLEANVWPCIVPVDYLSGLALYLKMVTVSSCGVKLQEVLSALRKRAKTLDIHVHFCGCVSSGGSPTPAGTSVFTKHNWDNYGNGVFRA